MTPSIATANLRLFKTLVLFFIIGSVVACASDSGGLAAESLVISPCKGDQATEFSAFSMEFDRLAWISLNETVATLELRKGHKAPTESDFVALQFTDLENTKNRWQAGEKLAIDNDKIRVSVSFNQTCPDQVQPLIAHEGELFLDSFDVRDGGEVAGNALFYLKDLRTNENVSSEVRLEFRVVLKRGSPHEFFSRTLTATNIFEHSEGAR